MILLIKEVKNCWDCPMFRENEVWRSQVTCEDLPELLLSQEDFDTWVSRDSVSYRDGIYPKCPHPRVLEGPEKEDHPSEFLEE